MENKMSKIEKEGEAKADRTQEKGWRKKTISGMQVELEGAKGILSKLKLI